MQNVFEINNCDYTVIDSYFKENNIGTILLVCDTAIGFLKYNDYFNSLEEKIGVKVVKFDDFKPNPDYSSVEKGVKLFLKEKCDSIVAIGGGSAIDVAKCIKLYSNMDHTKNYLQQTIVPNEVNLSAIPTTSGTGSEATRYAVIYYNGEKQSVADFSCIPSTVFMDSSVLETLPIYQKKATMLDALCHSIESFWSVNSTEESQQYSQEAIKLILQNKVAYLANEKEGNANMLKAANIAGKAINITQTTAGHAMCYKLTSLYGIAHGHAAALCVPKLWEYMVKNIHRCIDSRGEEYLKNVFSEIAKAMGCKNADSAIALFENILTDIDIKKPQINSEKDYAILNNSVNPVRLKNNPVGLDAEAIDIIYHKILN